MEALPADVLSADELISFLRCWCGCALSSRSVTLPVDIQREVLFKAMEHPHYICPKDNGHRYVLASPIPSLSRPWSRERLSMGTMSDTNGLSRPIAARTSDRPV